MPSPSPRDPPTGRKRRKVIRTDTRDDLDALKREQGGQTSAPVPVVGLARGDVTELHPLDGTDGLPVSRRTFALNTRTFFPRGKVRKTLEKPHADGAADPGSE